MTVRTKKGLSILELMGVVAILATLLAVGGITLSSYMRQLRINEATRVVSDTLARVRDDALRQSRQLRLDETYLTNGILLWRAGDTEVARITLPPGTVISSVNKQLPAQPITFLGRGLASQQVQFTIKRGKLERSIILFPTGLVMPL